MLELEGDKRVGKEEGLGEHGIRVGDIVRVGEQPKGGERKREKAGMETRACEGVVVRVLSRGIQVALGEGKGEEDAGLGGRLWV